MKKLLIIEDEPALSKALATKMSSEGFEVMTAGNGQEGLSIAIENKPELILLDIVMPVMDGITMLKKLRQDPWGKSVKVIVLTNLGNDVSKMADAMENDVTAYIEKTDSSMKSIAETVKEKLNIQK